MPQALAPVDAPPAQRICAQCAHSRNREGQLFTAEDRAYCGHPEVKSDSGDPVPCELHRFAKASALMHICGEEAIFWEPRT